MDWFEDRARTLGVQHAAPPPVVLGRHLLELGIVPGPEMGVMLKTLYERQLDGDIQSLDEGLAAARALIAIRG